MTISLRTTLIAALAAAIGLIGWLVFVRGGDGEPQGTARVASPAGVARAVVPASERVPAPARQAPEVPYGTVDGKQPGSSITLLSLRRSGPKVVSARLRISFHGSDDKVFMPREGVVGDYYTAADMRLIDEVNGREHFVLRNSDGECLCSGEFEVVLRGETSVISAKFPAPPANVDHVSLETPGFASFDHVPLA